MNYSTSVLLINENIRTVKGLYEEHGKQEIFKTVDKSLNVDDFAVVESTTRWGMTTVKITAVDVTDEVDFDSSCQMKWAIGKIGKEDHDKLKKMENDLIAVMKIGELRKRREEITKNVLDAKTAGELGKLAIAQLASPTKEAAE